MKGHKRKNRIKIALTLLSLLLSTSDVWSLGIFTNASINHQHNELTSLPPFLSRSMVLLKSQVDKELHLETGQYLLATELLNKFRQRLTADEYTPFLNWYYSYLYFNSARAFMDDANAYKIEMPGNGVIRYNQNGQYPLDGIIKGVKYLETKRFSKMNISDILQLHQILLSKKSIDREHEKNPANSEDTLDGDLGKFRREVTFFKIGDKIDSVETKCYGKSLPFHNWKTENSPKTYTEINDYNPYLSKFVNTIYYVTLGQWHDFEDKLTPATINLIKKTEAELIDKGTTPQTRFGKGPIDKPYWYDSKNGVFVYRKFIHDLFLSTLRETQNDLEHARTREEIILASVKFYRNFLSIHPFVNGNGRTARVLLSKILNDYNISTPIMVFPHLDVTFSLEDLYHVVKDSITIGENFHSNLLFCAEHDLFWGLASPILTKSDITLPVPIHGEYFMTWLYYQPAKTGFIPDIISQYHEHLQQIGSEKNFKGPLKEEQKHAHLVTPTYFTSFKQKSISPQSFDFKKKTYYHRNKYSSKLIKSPPLFSPLSIFSLFKTAPFNQSNRTQLAKTFHLFNKIIVSLSEIDRNFVNISNIAHDEVIPYDQNESPECHINGESFMQIISFMPRHGTIHWDDRIDLIGGMDPEAISIVRYCQVDHLQAKLITIRRDSFESGILSTMINGKDESQEKINFTL